MICRRSQKHSLQRIFERRPDVFAGGQYPGTFTFEQIHRSLIFEVFETSGKTLPNDCGMSGASGFVPGNTQLAQRLVSNMIFL